MQQTLDLDEKLIATARELTGEQKTDLLVEAALTALIQRESARKLARAGGAYPDLVAPPRRRGDEV